VTAVRYVTSSYWLDSKVEDRGGFLADWAERTVKNEPMFFNASLDLAQAEGGLITRAFIDALPPDWRDCNPVLDSRVHMLMPGWYPCIPGWHHDDVARGADGQPDYDDMPYQAEHLMGLVNGDICPTLFAHGSHLLPKVEGGLVYKTWHDIVERQIADDELIVEPARSGRLLQFDWSTMHTGQKAIAGGWRWFVRLSRNTARQQSITNERRRQVQVYLENPTEGW
jgi:hypothetical protein